MSHSSTRAAILSLDSNRVVSRVFWGFTFAVLTAVGAQIEIPHQPVPFTLQTFFVLLAGGFLGPRYGAAAMMAYLFTGAAGFPVFSGGGAGLARILGPTGGYLLAFPVAAFVVGTIISVRREWWWTAAAMTSGLLVIFAFGTIQLHLVLLHNFQAALSSGFLVFSWWDMVKLAAATGIVHYYRQRAD